MSVKNVMTIAAINSRAVQRSIGTYLLMVFFMPIAVLVPLVIISGGRYNVSDGFSFLCDVHNHHSGRW